MDGKIENNMEAELIQQLIPLHGACFEVLSEVIGFRD